MQSNADHDLAYAVDRIKRWRRGWLTLYRVDSMGETMWWLYGPFNLAVGFAHPGKRS